MIRSEKGFSTIELIVVCAIIGLIGSAASMTIFQVLNVTARSNDYMTTTSQLQNAGFWISRDAQMTENVTTENLSGTNFLVLDWNELDESDNTTTHSVTYFFEELTDGIGNLKRHHWSSTGANSEVLVAKYISYDPADPVNTSNASFQDPTLAVKLISIFGDTSETREYNISRRTNL